jgi:hypothetical protein
MMMMNNNPRVSMILLKNPLFSIDDAAGPDLLLEGGEGHDNLDEEKANNSAGSGSGSGRSG